MTLISRRHICLLLGGFAASPVFAERVFTDSSGLAIRGYDPVAYFAEEVAMRGSLDFQHERDDALWQFDNAENMDRFVDAPEKYMPQFGGFCAEGIARGFKRVSDPNVWVMVDGKLYLHYSIEAQNRWAEDIRANIKSGRVNWSSLRDL